MSTEIGSFVKLTLFGESHGPAVGAVLDSPPAGYKIDTDAVKSMLLRRAPGTSSLVSARAEADEPEFISGLYNGVTTGAPLTVIIRNTDANRGDYETIKNTPRPSHADYAAYVRFGGNCDMSGGGPFSGRLTAPLTAMGAVIKGILKENGIEVGGHILKIGNVSDERLFDTDPTIQLAELSLRPFPVISHSAEEKMKEIISDAASRKDSIGGEVEIAVTGLPAGIGSLMSRGLESIVSSAVFCVPAIKGIEFGAGFSFASMYGSAANDRMYYDENGTVKCRTNNCGGITGGISNGMPLIIRAALKPTPSVSCIQETVDLASFENTTVSIKGRHDPCIVPRALPAIESAVAAAVLDALCEVKKL